VSDELDRAWELLQLRRPREAADAALRRLQRIPDDPHALAVLSIAQYYLGRGADAVASLERALAGMPAFAHGHYLLGWLHHNLGAEHKSVVSTMRALAIEPRHAQALAQLARLREQAGRHEDALDSLDQALAVEPTNPDHHLHRARMLRDLGDLARAGEATATGLHHDATHAGLLRLQGELRLVDVDAANAAEVLAESVRRQPDDARARGELLHALRTDHAVHRWFWRRFRTVPETMRPLLPLGILMVAFLARAGLRSDDHALLVTGLLGGSALLVRVPSLRLLWVPLPRRLMGWPGRVSSLLLLGILLSTAVMILTPWFGDRARPVAVQLAHAGWLLALLQVLAEAIAREHRREWARGSLEARRERQRRS